MINLIAQLPRIVVNLTSQKLIRRNFFRILFASNRNYFFIHCNLRDSVQNILILLQEEKKRRLAIEDELSK